MKKLFHRKKRNEPDASPSQLSPYSGRSEPGLRTSLYDTTTASGLPQTGDYPIRGNDTPNVLRKKPPSRRSSIRSWRSTSSQQPAPYNRSPTPDRYARSQIPSPPSQRDMGAPEAYAPPPTGQKRWSRSQLPQDFSQMNLDGEAPTFTTTTTTTTGPYTSIEPSKHEPSEPSAALQRPLQSQGQRHNDSRPVVPSIRPVNPTSGQDVHVSPISKYNATVDERQDPKSGFDGARRASIPRKQVGTGSSSSAGKGHNHGRTAEVASSSTPEKLPGRGTRTGQDAAIMSNGTEGDPESGASLNAQAVISKAQTSTRDTSVSEKYAPAVVHETVHQDVHHVREELIRREVHTHDVYHRVLPVVDVEVLPARHFLPVEGGGLVEISANEVPGRSNNWVLAETMSQVPSDQPAPHGARNFTAREFPDGEGDDMKYTTPEGYERTEQTWVHPPELETGARDTGQSWPMVFGKDEAPKEGTYGHKSPKSSKKKRSSKPVGTGLSGPA